MSRIFHRGQIPFLAGIKIFAVFLTVGHNTQEKGADYLIVTKYRLVFTPYALIRSFSSGAETYNSNYIRGIFTKGICPTDLIYQKHIPYSCPRFFFLYRSIFFIISHPNIFFYLSLSILFPKGLSFSSLKLLILYFSLSPFSLSIFFCSISALFSLSFSPSFSLFIHLSYNK